MKKLLLISVIVLSACGGKDIFIRKSYGVVSGFSPATCRNNGSVWNEVSIQDTDGTISMSSVPNNVKYRLGDTVIYNLHHQQGGSNGMNDYYFCDSISKK